VRGSGEVRRVPMTSSFIDTMRAEYAEPALGLDVRPNRIDFVTDFHATAKYAVKTDGNAVARRWCRQPRSRPNRLRCVAVYTSPDWRRQPLRRVPPRPALGRDYIASTVTARSPADRPPCHRWS
jgi:hypothetical protein